MQINKIFENTKPEVNVKNISQGKAQAASAAADAAAKPAQSSGAAALSRSVNSLITAAGLPQDKLSASIISFARFFSLALKPELLAEIRRKSFTTPQNPPQAAPEAAAEIAEQSPAAKTREQAQQSMQRQAALSLAAAAAESKGIELTPKGLEAYAHAIDPDLEKKHDGRRKGRENKDQTGQDDGSSKKIILKTPGGLKEEALNSIGADPLLAVLNKLPGKSGQRWIVLPLDFSENGINLKVSMRILMDKEYASCMALDIVSYPPDDSEQRQLFMLEAAANKPVKLTVFFQRELSLKENYALKQKLSELLEIPVERIHIKERADSFFCETNKADELPAVDEAV